MRREDRAMRWPLYALLGALAVTAPAAAQSRAKAVDEQLDRLFKALRAAPDEAAAAQLEGRIHGLWLEQASPTANLLMARGERDLANQASGEAVADFGAALDLDPDFAEGYTRRAVARAASGDDAGALADIEQAMRRDPRHFSALQILSRLAEQQGNWAGALAAWQKALDIDPLTRGGIERLEMLHKKAEGEAT